MLHHLPTEHYYHQKQQQDITQLNSESFDTSSEISSTLVKRHTDLTTLCGRRGRLDALRYLNVFFCKLKYE